jgi:hypothetical protein
MVDEGTAVMEEAAVKCDGGSRSEGNSVWLLFFVFFYFFGNKERWQVCV